MINVWGILILLIAWALGCMGLWLLGFPLGTAQISATLIVALVLDLLFRGYLGASFADVLPLRTLVWESNTKRPNVWTYAGSGGHLLRIPLWIWAGTLLLAGVVYRAVR
jgi:hypothetical protein